MSVTAVSIPDRFSSSGSVDIEATSAGRLRVRGALTFATARRASEQGLRAIHTSGAREIEVDCGGVTATDSAGLAVLLDWLAAAKREGYSLRFTNLPSGMLALARISDVEELLLRGV